MLRSILDYDVSLGELTVSMSSGYLHGVISGAALSPAADAVAQLNLSHFQFVDLSKRAGVQTEMPTLPSLAGRFDFSLQQDIPRIPLVLPLQAPYRVRSLDYKAAPSTSTRRTPDAIFSVNTNPVVAVEVATSKTPVHSAYNAFHLFDRHPESLKAVVIVSLQEKGCPRLSSIKLKPSEKDSGRHPTPSGALPGPYSVLGAEFTGCFPQLHAKVIARVDRTTPEKVSLEHVRRYLSQLN